MRRANLPVVVTGAILLIAYASPAESELQKCKHPSCRLNEAECEPDDTKPCECTVTVELTAQRGQCAVESLQPKLSPQRQRGEFTGHQVQVCRKDTVVWDFLNNCDTQLILKIENFRQDNVIVDRAAKATNRTRETVKKEDLFDADPLAECERQVSVARGKSGKVTCGIKLKAHHPRTYKYDIVWQGPGSCSGMLDPEIEIYR